jgi:sugar lactone lactonase YvrE
MKTSRSVVALLIATPSFFLASNGFAHPGSGIVVDEQGQVFFADLTRGLLKIDAQAKTTAVHSEGGHWLALDPQGSFSRMHFASSDHWPRWFKRRTPEGVRPALITDGGSPLVIGRDGNLYYVCNDEKMIPGGLQIARLSPDGTLALVNPKLREVSEKLGGFTGLACGPDGVLYASHPKAISKIDLRGNATTLVNPVVISDCDLFVPPAAGLRGLTVDDDGSVFAAATGCGCVIKVTPAGHVSTVLKAEKPWAPCGVALHRGDLYVLEHINPNSEAHEDWPPRVRRLTKDGRVTTLFTAAQQTGSAAERDRPLLVPAPGSPIAASGSAALIAGDVNRDGFADLVRIADKKLDVIFGSANRDWSAEPDVLIDLESGATEAALADVNRDGLPDLVLAHHDSYDVTVLLGSGDGKFLPAKASPFAARDGSQPHTHGLAVADVNGDGRLDIVTANNDDGDLSLLLGDGKGTFVRATKSPFPCGKSPYPIAAADLNGDGGADVLVPNATHSDPATKTLTILLGNKQGELVPAPGSPLACDATVWYVATGDLNGDGRPDVVATHSEGGTGASVFLNDGDGKFVRAPGAPLEFGHGSWGVEIADMNGDGRADCIVAGDESIRVLLGDGRGQFKPASGSPFKTGKGAWRLVVGDFNGDGRPDVATRCVEANRLEVLLGNARRD